MAKGLRIISILLILFNAILVKGQDSITENNDKKVKLYLAFDASRSILAEPNVKFNGGKIGVEIKEKHRLGLALYGLSRPVKFLGRLDRIKYPTSTDTLFFDFSYLSLFYDYIWLRTKRWDLTTPIHLGSGNISISYLDTTGQRSAPFLSQSVGMLGFGGAAQFKVFRWFALGAGVGYRKMLTRDINIGRSLTAPYYQFQLKLLVGELYRMTFRRRELEAW